MRTRTTGRIDWTTLVAVVLVIVLFVLAIFYYWRPAATDALDPRWWQWTLMSLLFFAAVAVAYHRHRSRSRAALHEALEAQREEMAAEASRRRPPAGSDPPARPARPGPGSPSSGPNRYRSITERAGGGGEAAPGEPGTRSRGAGEGDGPSKKRV